MTTQIILSQPSLYTFSCLQMSVQAVELLFFSKAEEKNDSVETDLRGTGGWQHVLHGTNSECLRGSSGDFMEVEMAQGCCWGCANLVSRGCLSPMCLNIVLLQAFLSVLQMLIR